MHEFVSGASPRLMKVIIHGSAFPNNQSRKHDFNPSRVPSEVWTDPFVGKGQEEGLSTEQSSARAVQGVGSGI